MCAKKQLCPNCQTGADSFKLDRHSTMCPYIGCHKNGGCSKYLPMNKTDTK